MAPHHTGATDLADRFPDLAKRLRPEPLRGDVRLIPNAIKAWDCRAILKSVDMGSLRQSGLMLPDAEGVARETIVPTIKARWDSTLPDAAFGIAMKAVKDALGWTRDYDRTLVGVYGVGAGFSWHRDDMLPAVANRDIAVSVALNDPSEYEGGALELPEAGLSIRPPAGMLVAFPASALHRVAPITAGVRKVLLTFILKGSPCKAS